MIKLIVGLGNPGQQYERTRHNVGFLFLDRLVSDCSAGNWVAESKFNGLVANVIIAGHKVALLKPQTFMNRSGISVAAMARYFKISPEQILVVHDELDFDVGKARLKLAGGHAGHNGLRDIIANLSDKGFYRLRLGIGRPVAGKSVADYVLGSPSKTDMQVIDESFDQVLACLNQVVSGDVASAMNKLN